MIYRFIEWLQWWYRNYATVELLKKERDNRVRHMHKHMYCELHGSLDCSHSTWNSKLFWSSVDRIDAEYRKKVSTLK